MKYTLLLLVITILVSCGKAPSEKFNYNLSDNPWIDAYKDHAFFACIHESYGDSIYKIIENKDAFNPFDGLTLDALQSAKYNGSKISKNMPRPAMCEDCKEGENYYMATCLHYYNSKELDSIAKAEYKKYKNLISE